MSNIQIIFLVLGAVLVVLVLLLAGLYHGLAVYQSKLRALWSDILIQVQYYCDNVPYTVESYQMLNSEDQQSISNLIELKIVCIKAKHSGQELYKAFLNLKQALQKVFEYRHQNKKAATDLRFIEAYTEFNHLDLTLEQTVDQYEALRYEYEQRLGLFLVKALTLFFNFQSFHSFKIK